MKIASRLKLGFSIMNFGIIIMLVIYYFSGVQVIRNTDTLDSNIELLTQLNKKNVNIQYAKDILNADITRRINIINNSENGVKMRQAYLVIGDDFEAFELYLREIKEAQKIKNEKENLQELINKFANQKISGKNSQESNMESIEKINQKINEIHDLLNPLALKVRAETAKTIKEIDASSGGNLEIVKYSILRNATLLILLILISIFLTYSTVKSITLPINNLIGRANKIANLDLLVDFTSIKQTSDFYGLAHALQNMIEEFRVSINEVFCLSDIIDRSSEEIRKGNDDMMNRIVDEANISEETSTSVEKIATEVNQITKNVVETSILAEESFDLSKAGNDMLLELVEETRKIKANSGEIFKISELIDQISFQINLLSLNASIEAARAGDKGRGFAVVAQEIRNLANQSNVAAKDVQAILTESVDGIDKVDKKAVITGERTELMLKKSIEIKENMNKIKNSSLDVNYAVEEIKTAISGINDSLQSNAVSTEEFSTISENLREQTMKLLNLTKKFKIEGTCDLQLKSKEL